MRISWLVKVLPVVLTGTVVSVFNLDIHDAHKSQSMGYLQLSARLAHCTGNQTYSNRAQKIWDWSRESPLLNEKDWSIADSTSVDDR
ncbi:uncharacterized protein ATNIH1004_008309 [Aspergillus tanneri]|uniref:mannan endo-1,6-alpha-mannosidase n=1 Tax=Aspergillus tanneri TaxID=1220188 RepID=A0A5M9MBB4_9EURO|nr:uncharacterized protein ATNIH1004_008309 [Aspergillus tanneri]KAA8644111.1 hypothetical protein ATNIH1004_008309 [Aspergillus tanneri]